MSLPFHPLVQSWFRQRFEAPTEAQELGWPAIAGGRHTLIAAPTGSGKTLAAFMTCLDGLVRAGLNGGLPDRTEVVYVSPLKALSNDIQRNLAEPLSGITALAESEGTPLDEIRVAVRTGDTPARERQAMAKRPPHILITTPESLYILLTSASGREGLKGVRTLILDELHAVAGNKRGSHLSLSVERLCELAEKPVTRIGLSATQRPIDEVARFLVGFANIDSAGNADCTVVDTGHRREMDLELQLPEDELGPIATHEMWGQTLDRIAEMVKAHETTLVFVNTRRLVERVAHQMSERLGEEAVVAHHGSLSRERRHDAEQRLKSGQVELCVATSSLELGIDIGSVDLVCQIGSPRSIGLLLQRVGRSGHYLGGTPKGRLFPLTRDELLECMAMVRGFRGGNLDRLIIPEWPLDVLAQQIVAECGAREWSEDALYELALRAYPYRDLPLERYEQVLETLSRGVAPREGRRSAYIHRDTVNRRLRGRRGARLAAITSGGAIPDNTDYDVIAEPENTFVGTVNEDFAIESMRGDVFLLGNTPWRIRRVESGRVRVEDAHGSSPTIPFWLGEAPGRTTELSDEVSELRSEIFSRQDSDESAKWLVEKGFSADAAEQAAAYVAEGVRILGTVPTKKRIVAERFFDDSGGMQLVIHSPFGSRINRAWGMSLRKQICRSFDFELQAAATEDGINLSLGPSQSCPLADVFRYITSGKAEEVLTQAILQAPLFGVRWRWDATRALAILRFSGGKKVPAPLQRMRSEDLLSAVFPEQVACQDNAMPGDIEVPDHPLVFETMRDCVTEAMDLDGMKSVLEGIERGDIEVFARDTTQPSVFSHQILNAMPYAFLDDAPLEERRSRAVALRRALPEDSRELGKLDEAAIEAAAADAWPLIRDADELHDALLTLGILPEADVKGGPGVLDVDLVRDWFADLVADGRAVTVSYGEDRVAWAATESVPTVQAAFPDARFDPMPQGRLDPEPPPSEDNAVLELVRGRVECIGPFTPADLAASLRMRKSTVDIALAHMEATGNILRGYFTPGRQDEEACDRRILARIHRATISGLRKAVEPVSAAVYGRFLFRWQRASGPGRGEAALLDVIEQLQGFESAAGAWESEILPLRIAGYDSNALDGLCLSGEVVWGRFNGRPFNGDGQASKAALSRSIPISLGLRESLIWLVNGSHGNGTPPGAASEVLGYLAGHGASFLPEIASGTRRMPSEVETGLWNLAATGLVTSDGFGAVRALVSGARKRAQRSSRYRRRGRSWRPASRWALLHPNGGLSRSDEFAANGDSPSAPAETAGPPPVRSELPRSGIGAYRGKPAEGRPTTAALPEDVMEARTMQLLHRYGVVFPEVLARDALAPRWRDLVRVYRRAEARGEIRGGRFVAGFVGEQFALPEAIDQLRNVRKAQPDGRLIAVSASDSLNLAGVLTPGPRVPAVLGNRVVYRDGVPVASLESGELRIHGDPDDATRSKIADLLGVRAAKAAVPA